MIGSDVNALAAEFVFTNSSRYSLVDNEINCYIVASNGTFHVGDNFIFGRGRDLSQYVSVFSTDEPFTRNCGQIIGAALSRLIPLSQVALDMVCGLG